MREKIDLLIIGNLIILKDIVTIRIENVQIFLNENLFTDKLLNKNYHILNN